MIRILVQNGADPNTSTKVLGHTTFNFLGLALEKLDFPLARLLLEKGADPNLIVHVG